MMGLGQGLLNWSAAPALSPRSAARKTPPGKPQAPYRCCRRHVVRNDRQITCRRAVAVACRWPRKPKTEPAETPEDANTAKSAAIRTGTKQVQMIAMLVRPGGGDGRRNGWGHWMVGTYCPWLDLWCLKEEAGPAHLRPQGIVDKLRVLSA